MVAVGRGAHAGILVRNAEALEMLAKADTLVVDKTGTLTEGKPQLLNIELFEPHGVSEDDLLSLAASVESSSEHPFARAIVRAANEKGLRIAPPTEFQSFAGAGVKGRVDGKAVLVGTAKFLREQGVEIPGGREIKTLAPSSAALTLIQVAVDGYASGVMVLGDQVKHSSASTMPPRSRLPMSALRWAREPMWPSRAPGSPSSKEICEELFERGS
jgi:Cu+-exporting ATPase